MFQILNDKIEIFKIIKDKLKKQNQTRKINFI